MAAHAGEGRWNAADLDVIQIFTKIAPEWNWAVLTAALAPRLEEAPPSLPEDAPFVLSTLYFLAPNSVDARRLLEKAAESEVLCYYFRFLAEAADWETVSKCCIPLLSAEQQFDRPNQGIPGNTPQWRVQQGRNYFNSFLQDPESRTELLAILRSEYTKWLPLERWREIAEEKSDRQPLLGKLLTLSLRADSKSITAKELVGHLAFWSSVAGEEVLDQSLKDRTDAGELANAVMDMPFSVADLHLYRIVLSEPDNARFKDFVRHGVREVPPEIWQDAIFQETELIDFVLGVRGGGFSLGRSFQDALHKHVERKLQDSSIGRLAEIWGEVVSLLDAHNRDVFLRRLLETFKSDDGRIEGLLPYYAPMLSSVVLADGPDRSYVRIKQIIDNHDVAEVNWLSELVEGWKGARPQSVVEDWASRASEFLGQDPPELERVALERFVRALAGQ
ncbi:MAG: hypothetical protein WB622_18515 [Acidobacteriaceae bacterium]